jgi:dnd system-associated protein 4
MAQQSIFSASRTVYWPSEYADLVNMLKGQDSNNNGVYAPMYRYNTGAIIFAAALGLTRQRERDIGPQRQEISTDTFEAHRFGSASLASFLLLIPLIGTDDIELLRPEREDELIRKFERYAAGGLEYLRGAMSHSSDSSGQSVIFSEVQHAMSVLEEYLHI